MPAKTDPGNAGDWLEVHSPGGGPPRRGLILEVLGAAGHEHYRVRWTDEHESIYYPADGAVIVPPNPARSEPEAIRAGDLKERLDADG